MGILNTLLSWFNRVVIIISVLCIALTLTAKQNDVPLSKASLRLGHLLAFSAWFGTSVWVSFIAGIVLIKTVDMDTFGQVQSKLFPAYFKFSFVCLAVTGFTGSALAAHNNTGVMGATIFVVALGSVVANLLFFEPQTTTTMMERRRICKELGVDRKSAHPQVRQLSKRFGVFHGISNLLNLAALCCGAVHLGGLAARLDI